MKLVVVIYHVLRSRFCSGACTAHLYVYMMFFPSKVTLSFFQNNTASSVAAPPVQVKTDTSDFDSSLIFEQDPVQIIDALLPLYLNSTLLRALQESLACELAARMNAMSSASDNAKDLKKKLNLKYNRQRQAAITGQIIEICSGSTA